MTTQQVLPHPRTILDDELDRYRTLVSAVFAAHHRVHVTGGTDVCTCGAAWPCPSEMIAEQLLDWV
jgi:hypothetical protein